LAKRDLEVRGELRGIAGASWTPAVRGGRVKVEQELDADLYTGAITPKRSKPVDGGSLLQLSWKSETTRELYRLLNEPPVVDEALAREWETLRGRSERVPWRQQGALPGPRKLQAFEHAWREVNALRQRPSTSIARNDSGARSGWQRAERLVRDWVAQGLHPTRERILELARALGAEGWRKKSYGKDGTHCASVEDLEQAIREFDEWYGANRECLHPIALAALAGQRLVTIHPVESANGRTSRLVIDWILQLNGLPPASYPERAGLGALHRHPWPSMDTPPTRVIQNVTGAVAHTLSIFEKNLCDRTWMARRKALIEKNHVVRGKELSVLIPHKDGRVRAVKTERSGLRALTDTIFNPVDVDAIVGPAREHFPKIKASIERICAGYPGGMMRAHVPTPEEARKTLADQARYYDGVSVEWWANLLLRIDVELASYPEIERFKAQLKAEGIAFQEVGASRNNNGVRLNGLDATSSEGQRFYISLRPDASRWEKHQQWFETHVVQLPHTEYLYRINLLRYHSAVRDYLRQLDEGVADAKPPEIADHGVRPEDVFTL
jgi:hypothetical protein